MADKPPIVIATGQGYARNRHRTSSASRSRNLFLPLFFLFFVLIAGGFIALVAIDQGWLAAPAIPELPAVPAIGVDPLDRFAAKSDDCRLMAEWFRDNLDEPDSFELIEVEGPDHAYDEQAMEWYRDNDMDVPEPTDRRAYRVKFRANWLGHPRVQSKKLYIENGEVY